MVKILSQAGNSLADTYDVEGSIAGIDHLETHELPIVHEMGGTVFSERYSTTIRRAASGALAQSTAINVVLTDLPAVPTRLLGVAVLSDVAARIGNLGVMISDGNREFPVWSYSLNARGIRLIEEGAAVAQYDILRPDVDLLMLPSMCGGTDQPQIVDQIALRGITTAFGAGTVFVRALYYIAFAQIGGVSSRGLPIPSW